jgi:Haem-binding uptake, Tiki superfamily, ChaN
MAKDCRIILFGESHHSARDREIMESMLRKSLDTFHGRNPAVFFEMVDKPHNKKLLANLRRGNIEKLVAASPWQDQLKARLELFRRENLPVVPIDMPYIRMYRIEDSYFYRLARDAYMSDAIDSYIKDNAVDLAIAVTGALHTAPLEAGLSAMGYSKVSVDFLNNRSEFLEYRNGQDGRVLSPLLRDELSAAKADNRN